MTTIASLITEVRTLLNDPIDSGNPFFEDNAPIVSMFQRAINKLCFTTDINTSTYEYEQSGDGSSSITLLGLTGGVETEIYNIVELGIKTAANSYYRDLLRVGPIDGGNIKENETTNVVSAEIYNGTLYLNASLADEDIIKIKGRWKKADITEGGTFPLNSSAEEAVINYALAMGYLTMAKEALFEKFMAFWLEDRKLIEIYSRQLIESQYPMAAIVHKTSNSYYPLGDENTITT